MVSNRSEIGTATEAAFEAFLIEVTVPLLFVRSENHVDQVGTGVFVEIAETAFLVTASHLFSDESIENFVLPFAAGKKADLRSLGEFDLIRPKNNENLDVAVLKLKDKTVIEELKQGWRFLSSNDFGEISDSDEFFVVAGFPSVFTSKSEFVIKGTLLPFITRKLTDVPVDAKSPVEQGLDFFLEKPSLGLDSNLSGVELVRFSGVSGAAVYKVLNRDAAAIWTPQNALKLVGVQSSEKHKEYLRCKSWKLAELLFEAGRKT